MWAKLLDLIAKVFTLTLNVERHEKQIDKLQAENKELKEIINENSAKINVLVYAVQAESDKTKMWVEKELMKFERRLPTENKKDDEKN